ncbi:VapE domain-containing protein [Aquimarina hainanensis]|uniref:VapE domain-containing protein n=1 Tax=Aquimarina hainanensis TaxID=1578017 RepID=A0ABW5N3Y2_9FLAO
MSIKHIEIGGDNQEPTNSNSLKTGRGKKHKKKSKAVHILKIQKYLKQAYDIRFNYLALSLEFKKPEESCFKLLDDRALNTIWVNIQLLGLKCSERTLQMLLRSEYTPSYHPLAEYFNKLKAHDGIDYIGQLAETVEITDLQIGEINIKELWHVYLQKWLVASVANCLRKGVNQTCLILVGNQGSGKTTWLNKLCPESMQEFLVCGHINPSLTDNNTVNLLAEKWLINIDDQLENIFQKDFNSMKAIITTPFVTNRKAFARMTKTRPRVSSFMGSVNSRKILTDTHNRRYLVFATETINFQHTIPMDKVWGQALDLFKKGFSYWFSDSEMRQLHKINEHFQVATIEQEWLSKVYEPCKPSDAGAMFLMSSEILSTLCAYSGLKLNQKKLSQAFEKLGYPKPIAKRINSKGVRRVYYVRKITDIQEKKFQQEIKQTSR